MLKIIKGSEDQWVNKPGHREGAAGSMEKMGGVQLHFCTWPPDFCQMYMYKNVQKCTKYVFSCLEVPWIDLLAVANLQWQVHHMGMYLITLTPFLLFLTGGFQVNQNARSYLT